ncbi:MAG: phospholipid carrier-dependent glycosyltransferase [Acidobacteriota bacterium]|nr:phospholipid carrier-dependent glycosyltransferase [Acidobacteriota bacterium]
MEDPARRHGYALAVALVLLISAALRLWQLGTPTEMMFDEIYYAKDAKAIVDGRIGTQGQYRWAAGDEVSWPHPEMGKFAIAAGIAVFGDRSFGWRLPAVLAGIGILACVYPLGRRLGLSPPWALLGLLLAATDPLGIAQSRIATLDVFIAFWTVLCVLLALRYVQEGWRPAWLFAAGGAGGMAAATKWSGGLALIAAAIIVAAAWILQAHRARATAQGEAGYVPAETDVPTASAVPSEASTAGPPLVPPHAEAETPAPPQDSLGVRILVLVAALVAVPVGFYLLSYAPYFWAGHTIADFRELHRQMVIFNLNLEATHTYASLAPTWIVDYRPVWYYFEGTETYRGVIAIGNPFLWWLATLSLAAAAALALLRRSYALLPAAGLVVVLYVPWFLATRTSFLYYMTPVAPIMAVLVAGALCLFAGGLVPRRGWLAAAAAALAAAVLWRWVGLGAAWLFWELPHRGGTFFAWVGLTVGVLLAALLLAFLLSERMRRHRPLMAMVVAGLTIGIVVAFVPIVLGLPISPRYFEHVMWFPSWI